MSHTDSAIALTQDDVARLIADRREFHRYPELAYNEQRTARVVAERLAEYGYKVETGVGGTGVVGLFAPQTGSDEAGNSSAASRNEFEKPGSLLYRADMDALPIEEENDVDYRSQNRGSMHACGQDAHVAIALAVAKKLAESRDKLSGRLKFVFQPAEEGGNGAGAMINDRVLESPDVTAAVGLHVWNNFS